MGQTLATRALTSPLCPKEKSTRLPYTPERSKLRGSHGQRPWFYCRNKVADATPAIIVTLNIALPNFTLNVIVAFSRITSAMWEAIFHSTCPIEATPILRIEKQPKSLTGQPDAIIHYDNSLLVPPQAPIHNLVHKPTVTGLPCK